MASLRDGLGGEELQISGLQAGGVNISPYFTGSVIAVAGLRDNLGRVRGAMRSHAGSDYGMFVQAGSVTTGNTGIGTIEFVEPFGDANWVLTMSANEFTIPAGSNVAQNIGISGTKRDSGCEVTGGSTTVFNFIAIGPISGVGS